MISSDNFFHPSHIQKLEEVILDLQNTNPELFQPPVPGSQKEQDLEKIHNRIKETENLSLADKSAYYKEYAFFNIDFLNGEK